MTSVGVSQLSVQLKGSKILSDVHMSCMPGTLTAILGPSGSGKTTLLSLIAGRFQIEFGGQEESWVRGRVLINGHACDTREELRQYCSYVPQHIDIPGYLTVSESIWMHAHLTQRGHTLSQKAAKVNGIMQSLDLTQCQNTLIGTASCKGVSGGQKKRVALGVTLLSDPSLLLLDEPTSGLDASLAFDLTKQLHHLAKDGKTVIATIHQPRPEVFRMFDSLMLLNEGSVCYHGPASQVGVWLTQIGYAPPTHYALSDYLLDILTPKMRSKDLEPTQFDSIESTQSHPDLTQPKPEHHFQRCTSRLTLDVQDIKRLPALYTSSQYFAECVEQARLMSRHTLNTPVTRHTSSRTAQTLSHYFLTLKVLISCYTKKRRREPSEFVATFFVVFWMAVACGALWWRRRDVDTREDGSYDCEQYNTIMYAIGWNVLDVTWEVFGLMTTLPGNKKYFNADVAAGLYTPSAAYLAQIISDLPFLTAIPLTTTILIACFVGYATHSITSFVHMLLTLILTSWCSAGFLSMLASFCPTELLANHICQCLLTMLTAICGFMITQDGLPAFWQKLVYFNWINFALDAIQLGSFDKDVTDACGIDIQGFVTRWGSLGYMALLAIGFRAIGYIGFRFTNRSVGLV